MDIILLATPWPWCRLKP